MALYIDGTNNIISKQTTPWDPYSYSDIEIELDTLPDESKCQGTGAGPTFQSNDRITCHFSCTVTDGGQGSTILSESWTNHLIQPWTASDTNASISVVFDSSGTITCSGQWNGAILAGVGATAVVRITNITVTPYTSPDTDIVGATRFQGAVTVNNLIARNPKLNLIIVSSTANTGIYWTSFGSTPQTWTLHICPNTTSDLSNGCVIALHLQQSKNTDTTYSLSIKFLHNGYQFSHDEANNRDIFYLIGYIDDGNFSNVSNGKSITFS